MALKFHPRADPNNLRPPAVCDRCGFIYEHQKLTFQTYYQGENGLLRTKWLVCKPCLDKPERPDLQTVRLTGDPKPVKDPRPPYRPLPLISTPPPVIVDNSAKPNLMPWED